MDARAVCRLVLFLAMALVSWASAATPTTYVIRPDGTGDFPTIQAAIDAAADGDIIELTDGTFTGPGNRDIDYSGKAITVRSQSGNPESSIIDCEASDLDPHRGCIFGAEGPESVLEGVTITHAYATGDGGGIACMTSSPTIRNCRISQCESYRCGGGIVCMDGASPTIVQCVFEYNGCGGDGPFGGGIASVYAAPVIDDCVISHNGGSLWPWSAGGIWLDHSSVVITNCVIDSNMGLGGGGISSQNSSVVISGCRFESNAAETGGAITAHGDVPGASVLTLESCSFTGNTADPAGECGGIVASGCELTITGCTFSGNGYGGAVWSLGSRTVITTSTFIAHEFANPGSPQGGAVIWSCPLPGESDTMEKTIIVFNRGPAVLCGDGPIALSCCDVYGNEGGDWTGCIADQLGVNGNICGHPLFCDLPQGDLTLRADSPCAPEHSGGCGLIGAWPVGCEATSVSQATSTAPGRVGLRVDPNPVRTDGIIRWASEGCGAAMLRLYDPQGRLVLSRELGDGRASWQESRWKDVVGESRPASGVYFLEIVVSPGERQVARVVVTR